MDAIQFYLEERKEFAESLGVKVVYADVPFKIIKGSFKAGGYFDEDRVFIALKHPDYASIAVHEFCHMDQWLADTAKYTKFQECYESLLFDDYINSKVSLSVEDVKKGVKVIRDMELDCEKRAVRQIIKYDLPIDVGTYVQKSNAYMFYHSAQASFRGYHTKKSPLMVPSILRSMPKYFLTSQEYDNPSQDFLLRVRKYCY